VFFGHEGSGKTMVVEAMADYLQQQKGYHKPSLFAIASQRNDEMGFNMAVDEIQFKEGLTMLHFPDLAYASTFRRDRIAVFKKSFSREFPHIDAIFLVLKVTKDFETMKHNRNAQLLAVLDLFDGQDVADKISIILTAQDKGAKLSRALARELCYTSGIEKLLTNSNAEDCNGISHIANCFTIDASAIPIKNSSTKNDLWFATDTSAIVDDNSLTFRTIFSLSNAPESSKKTAKKQRKSALFEKHAAAFEELVQSKKVHHLETNKDDE